MTLNPIEFMNIRCPYCNEEFAVCVDTSVLQQESIEDCTVCCSPVVLNILINSENENIEVSARREND